MIICFFFFQAEDGIRDIGVTGVQTCALPICRANANKEMVRIVRKAIAEYGARLATWHGGNMRNAIPFKAEVVLALPQANVAGLTEMVAKQKEVLEEEYKLIEKSVELHVEEAERSEEHTSELQSRQYLVCRLLLEKKK